MSSSADQPLSDEPQDPEIQWRGPGIVAADRHDEEPLNARRIVGSRLYHYTSADAGLLGILLSGSLRLSAFQSTNDLWEAQPLYPTLEGVTEDDDGEDTFALWGQIDLLIRQRVKIACLTIDWNLPHYVSNYDVLSGWCHLALWSHYGGGHTGICIGFDRERLTEALRSSSGLTHFWPGQVRYQLGTHGLIQTVELERVRREGVEAVATDFFVQHHNDLYFRKHMDWANEHEYRLVGISSSALPHFLDIRSAVEDVVLGAAFPAERLPELKEILADYDGVSVRQFRSHNRHLGAYPVEGFPSWRESAGEGAGGPHPGPLTT